MAYFINGELWSGVFAVPNTVVDKHIKLCGPLSLKVLLTLLRRGGSMEPEELASVLGQSSADVRDALNYWIENGVIRADNTENEITELKWEAVAPSADSQSLRQDTAETTGESGKATRQRKAPAVGREGRPRLTTQQINEMADQDQSVGNLIQETQSIIGKPLTPLVTDLVAGLYGYYGMKPDIILMLIQYCVSIEKESVRYIEKVAAAWMDEGIDSHEKAEAEILRATKKNQIESRIKAAFGIYDRSLVTSEKKYIETWISEYRMDLPLITLAFERAVEVKGKLSFAYINGILSNWHKKGITTPKDAMREIADGSGKPVSGNDTAGSGFAASYDMTALEEMIASGKDIK